jgi:short-subunit dehydrogenase
MYHYASMKKAIVVGASSGIGYQLVLNLVADGYLVGVTARRLDLLTQLAERVPGKIFPMQMDVREIDSIPAKLEGLKTQLPGIDLMIISAGVGELNAGLDFHIEKDMIDTNVTGFTAIADWAFNNFSNQKSGILVAITSIAGLRGNRQSPAYSATKAYQQVYLEGLRQKAHKISHSIHVIDIRPGFVNTKMAKGDKVFWVSSVEKASNQIMRAIIHKSPIAYITRRWYLVAGLMKLLPRFVHKRM